MIRIAYKASRYDKAKEKATGQKPKAATPAPSGKPRTQTTADVTKIDKQFRTSGTVDDAAALLRATRAKR